MHVRQVGRLMSDLVGEPSSIILDLAASHSRSMSPQTLPIFLRPSHRFWSSHRFSAQKQPIKAASLAFDSAIATKKHRNKKHANPKSRIRKFEHREQKPNPGD